MNMISIFKNICLRPVGWGNNSFSEFMIAAEENGYATFQKEKAYYDKLSTCHNIFNKAIDSMHNSEYWFELLFFIKAHSAFMAASRLGLATQVTEASPIIRSIIENSLYGYFLHKHPEYHEIWLKRHESEAAKKEVKKVFNIRTMIDELKSSDAKLGEIAETLYEQSIDYGAHPNERGLTAALKYTKSEESIRYDVVHLTNDPVPIRFCLKFIAQSAILSLKILQLILPERLRIVNIDLEIDRISKDL